MSKQPYTRKEYTHNHIHKENFGKYYKLFQKKNKKRNPQPIARERKWLKSANFRDKHSSVYSEKKRKNKCDTLILRSLKNMTDHHMSVQQGALSGAERHSETPLKTEIIVNESQ